MMGDRKHQVYEHGNCVNLYNIIERKDAECVMWMTYKLK